MMTMWQHKHYVSLSVSCLPQLVTGNKHTLHNKSGRLNKAQLNNKCGHCNRVLTCSNNKW